MVLTERQRAALEAFVAKGPAYTFTGQGPLRNKTYRGTPVIKVSKRVVRVLIDCGFLLPNQNSLLEATPAGKAHMKASP